MMLTYTIYERGVAIWRVRRMPVGPGFLNFRSVL